MEKTEEIIHDINIAKFTLQQLEAKRRDILLSLTMNKKRINDQKTTIYTLINLLEKLT